MTLALISTAMWSAVFVLAEVRFQRLRRQLRQHTSAATDQAIDLEEARADNDRLQLLNRGLARDLQNLRDENVRLLRSWVTGETA